MDGPNGTGDAEDGSASALIFLGRRLDRLTPSVDAGAGWGGVASVGADVASSFARASDDPCTAILASKASSTILASSADSRFLAFRMAIARGCRPSSGRVWISWI